MRSDRIPVMFHIFSRVETRSFIGHRQEVLVEVDNVSCVVAPHLIPFIFSSASHFGHFWYEIPRKICSKLAYLRIKLAPLPQVFPIRRFMHRPNKPVIPIFSKVLVNRNIARDRLSLSYEEGQSG